MPKQSVENDGLAQRAYVTMRDRITRGEYAIGQVISRRSIAADLGISFLPASEALLRLECEGLLESRPRAGTRIRIPTHQEMHGHLVLREALEVQAAILFAAQATPEQRNELHKLGMRLDARRRKAEADMLAYIALHDQLHLRIAQYAACPALEEAIRKVSALGSAWLCAMQTTIPPDAPLHEPLVKALSKEKSTAAGDAMRSHLRSEMEATLLLLEPHFELHKKHMQTYSRTIRRQSKSETTNAQRTPAGLHTLSVKLSPVQLPA